MSFLALTADSKIHNNNDNDQKKDKLVETEVKGNQSPPTTVEPTAGKLTTTSPKQQQLLKGGGSDGNRGEKKIVSSTCSTESEGEERRREPPARRHSQHDQRPSTDGGGGNGGGGGGGSGRRRRSTSSNSNNNNACHAKMTLSVSNGSNTGTTGNSNGRSRTKGGRSNHSSNPRWAGKQQSAKPYYGQHHPHHPPRHSRNNHDHHLDDALWDDDGLDASLEQWLRRRGAFDASEGLIKRQSVLTSLGAIVGDWSDSLRFETGQQHKQLQKGFRDPQAHPSAGEGGADGALLLRRSSGSPLLENDDENTFVPRATLVCFGSYRLGVQRPEADIDLLLLAPRHCSRTDFFQSLVSRLSNLEAVSEIHPIPSAYTPVLKFRFDGIAVDLLFASLKNDTKLLEAAKRSCVGVESVEAPEIKSTSVPLSLASLPSDIQLTDEDLMGLDEASVRSINGVRIAQMLLAHVPDVDAFRLCLRAVKEWAIVNGLYSNVLGFLGGVNFAIMVAWVCKRHPQMTVTSLLRAFFNRFANWRWPTAVKLGSLATEPPAGVPYMQAWNPKSNPRDGAHVMPIITPVYPCMNSAYNVGFPHCRRIQNELRRADAIVSAIGRGQRGWGELFASSNFFRENFHFLQIDTSAATLEDFTSWFGFVESRLRILIVSLDAADMGVHSIPFARFYRRRSTDASDATKNEHMTTFFIGLRFASSCEQVDLQSCMGEFLYKVNSWEERRPGMDLRIKHVLRNDLPSFVFEDDIRSDDTRSAQKTTEEIAELLEKDETTAAARSVLTENQDSPNVMSGEVPPNPSPLKRARRKSPEGNHHHHATTTAAKKTTNTATNTTTTTTTLC